MLNVKQPMKLKVRRGDTVRVLRGRDRGKKGKILSVIPAENRVIIEGINIVHKHVRPRRAGEKGQRVEAPAPLSVANIQLVCPQCNQGTRVGIQRTDGQRERICKKCQTVIGNS